MFWKVGAVLLVSLAASRCSPIEGKTCACPFILKPVCGSDGVTYDNDCMLKCLNPSATLEYRGGCGKKEVPCICGDEDDPVCGNNDRTYPNACYLDCDKTSLPDLALKHSGACKEKRNAEIDVCPCLIVPDPVCASDGKTYESNCEMNCRNPEATIKHHGVCGNNEPPTCVCDHTSSPVCGSDDKTYANECELNCAKLTETNLTVLHEGACKEKRNTEIDVCPCLIVPDPVCASDGKTYESNCEMNCRNPEATIKHHGVCGNKEPPTCVCDHTSSPVCGSDDKTYANECELNCVKLTETNLTVLHEGACKEKRNTETKQCACPFISRPVCGSDGVTYDNDCILKCYNPEAKLDYYGRCGQREIPCVCPAEDDPVCGSNDRTYPSECYLKCDRSLPNLVVKHNGACKTRRSPKPKVCGCPFISRPVCASDSRTYESDCEMRCENPDLKVLHEGPCKSKRNTEKDPCSCPYDLNPVCGSDGKTYGNSCHLDCEKFRSKQENLHMVHTGKCKSKRSVDLTDCDCPLRILREMCGTDGHTYANDCYFECAKAKFPTLGKAYEGRCGKPIVPCEDCSNAGDQRVCGTNDRSYPNECVLKCEKINGQPNLTVAHIGDCKHKRSVEPKICVCTLLEDPLCGTDGVTYPNECMLKCKNPEAKVQSKGACKTKRSTEACTCPAILMPVCGTDGVTYANDCILGCENPNAKIKHRGACKSKRSAEQCDCPAVSFQVCGSDGNTYTSECEMKCQHPELTAKYDGPCRLPKRSVEREVVKVATPLPLCDCPSRVKKEVCGTDGVTYVNECFLGCAKSRRPSLAEAHKGPCEDKVSVVDDSSTCLCVDRTLREICGTDGKTYVNDCYFDCAKSKNKGLEREHDGPCSSVTVVGA